MRQLVLLRGSPACGKSTFITTHDLEPYTLSADTIRLQYCSPALSINGDWAISQRNDKIVWDTLFKMLEVRMQNGCFTVVDATNSKTAEMNRYKELCQKYRYRIMCVDMTDVPIEVCKERNSKRAEYKRVPEEVIDNMYSRFATQNIPSGIKVVKPEEFEEAIQYTPMDLSEYDAVYVIGDIHGCKQPFDDFNNDIFNHGGKKNFFIFCGDYVDRGTQNAEVLDFLYRVKDNKNVLLLEGNHECFAKGTEVLTKFGWKKIENTSCDDVVANFDLQSGIIKYSKPLERIVKHSDMIYHIESDRMCQYVTPNHDIVYKNQKIKAKDLPANFEQKDFRLFGSLKLNDYKISDDELKLIVWTVCDSTIVLGKKYNPNSSKVRVQWHLSREDKIKNLTNLLDSMGISYTFRNATMESQHTVQPVYITVYGEDAKYIVSLLDIEDNKEFPFYFTKLSHRQAHIVIDELTKTDGRIISSIKYNWMTTNLRDVNIIQQMCIINDIACTYVLKPNASGYKDNCKMQYSVTINPNEVYNDKQAIKECLEYNDEVYCLTMPLGTLITRYNGKIAFSGNCHLHKWATDQTIYSKEFVNYTLPQLEQAKFTKKQAREFYRKLGQCCYFTYDNETFFVCHGGISRVPVNPIFVPTIQMVDGVGKYSDYKDVADTFSQHKSNNYATYLINGHRNINDFNTEVNNYCYNLEGKVEFGGNLRVVRIGKGEEIKCLEYPNKLPIAEHLAKRETNFVSDNATTDDTNFEGTAEELEIRNLVRTFRKNKYVVEKQFGNISSFNFSRQAFNEKIWTDATTKARGLYIDTLQNKIFCRGYEKFFKINETEETKLPTLARNLQFPVTVYQKENGYLGLISYDYYNDDLFFTTKSNPDGDYAVHFKNLFKCMVKNTQRDFLKQFLKDCNSTLAVEVIDPLFDPHIIKYTKSKIVCLDLIKNSLEFAKSNYTILQNLANALELDYKVHIQTINNWECFEDFIDRAAKHSDRFSDNGEHIEGWVLEDNSGYMTKLKSNYYNVWKSLRGVAYSTIKSGHYRYTGSLQHPMQNYFYGWLKKNWEHYHYNDTVPKDIISLREDFIKDNPHFAASDYY